MYPFWQFVWLDGLVDPLSIVFFCWINPYFTIGFPVDMLWFTEAQKDKQPTTKHYTGNKRSSNTNPLKTGSELGCSGKVNSSCSTSEFRSMLDNLVEIFYGNYHSILLNFDHWLCWHRYRNITLWKLMLIMGEYCMWNMTSTIYKS